MRALLSTLIRRLHREESGQSLIVTVSSMAVMLVMAAYGISVADWYANRHKVQVVADAAALAAANCLANPGAAAGNVNGASVPSCTSGTDTTDATTVAIDYAAANGITITASQVSFSSSNKTVTVQPAGSAPGLFAALFGIQNVQPKATSVAGWKSTSNSCETPGQNCDFMFANSSDCNSGSYVLIVSTQGASTINGNIQTNGSLDASATGNAGGIYGQGTYGPGSCTTTTTGGNKDPWKTSPPTQATSDINWPIDYSKDFPACSGSACTGPPCSGSICNGATNYPSYCTNVSSSSTGINFGGATGGAPVPGNVYCATGSGSGVNVDDPSTWTGTITINSSGNNTWDDTYVAGQISYTGAGGDTLSSCGYTAGGYSSSICSASKPATSNYPIFYAVEADPNSALCAAGTSVSTNCALSVSSNGNLSLYGDVFVEYGTASLNFQGNQSAGNTFIEANVIGATMAGNFNGDGPTLNGSGTPIPGSDTLLQ